MILRCSRGANVQTSGASSIIEAVLRMYNQSWRMIVMRSLLFHDGQPCRLSTWCLANLRPDSELLGLPQVWLLVRSLLAGSASTEQIGLCQFPSLCWAQERRGDLCRALPHLVCLRWLHWQWVRIFCSLSSVEDLSIFLAKLQNRVARNLADRSEAGSVMYDSMQGLGGTDSLNRCDDLAARWD